MVGAGLVLFYLALLSLSETLPFTGAYAIAASLLSSLVTWYVWMMFATSRLDGPRPGVSSGPFIEPT